PAPLRTRIRRLPRISAKSWIRRTRWKTCCSSLPSRPSNRWMNRHNNLVPYSVRIVRWQQAQEQLRDIREQVFIEEQQVPVALEWDGLDENAIHVLILDAEGRPIGCARILAD